MLAEYGQEFSDWYLGAIVVLGDGSNPARFSQSAQSIREIIEKLPRKTSQLFDTDRTSNRELNKELDEAHASREANGDSEGFLKDYSAWSKRWDDFNPGNRDRISYFRVTRSAHGKKLPDNLECHAPNILNTVLT